MLWETQCSFRKCLCIGCVGSPTPVSTLLMGVRRPPQVGHDWRARDCWVWLTWRGAEWTGFLDHVRNQAVCP